MSGFAIFLLLFPLIGVLVLSIPMVAKFDWDIPVYKKIFIATAFLIAASFTVRTFLIFDNEDYDNKLTLVYIDNYEETLEHATDVKRSLIIAMVDRAVSTYFQKIGGVVRKMEKDRYLIAFKRKYYFQT